MGKHLISINLTFGVFKGEEWVRPGVMLIKLTFFLTSD